MKYKHLVELNTRLLRVNERRPMSLAAVGDRDADFFVAKLADLRLNDMQTSDGFRSSAQKR